MPSGDSMLNMMSNFYSSLRNSGSGNCFAVWHGVLWMLWKTRNEVIFKGVQCRSSDVFEAVKSSLWLWLRSHNLIRKEANLVDWELFPLEVLVKD